MKGDEGRLKAKTLVEALPYIRRFAGKTLCVKFGASLLGDAEAINAFARDIVLLKYVGLNVVVVHGGGDEVTRWAERIGKKAEFVDGVRITDRETIEITEMVLSGRINREFVAALNHAGGKACGISGKDSHTLLARRVILPSGRDAGFAGELEQVNVSLLETLLAQGYIPVVSAIGTSLRDETLALRSDEVASGIAAALKAAKLIYLTNVSGVMKGGKLLSLGDYQDTRALMDDPEVTGGMRSKLAHALRALKAGVADVHVLNGREEHSIILELFTDHGVGTMLTNERVRV